MDITIPNLKWAFSPGALSRADNLIIHHAAAKTAAVEDIHRWHLANGWAGIAYHYYVRKDGEIFRGRPENWAGGHTVGYNSSSLGLCFEGNFDQEHMAEEQLLSGAMLVRDIKRRYPGIRIMPHRDAQATACPGKNFPFFEIIDYKEDEMDAEAFSKMMDDYLDELASREPDPWSEAARGWAEKNGLLIGDENGKKAYKRFLTREEFVMLAWRAAEEGRGK